MINQGKLAVVQGIEVSEPFDCGIQNGVPELRRASRSTAGSTRSTGSASASMELINKFDNALGGVAGDSGAIGVGHQRRQLLRDRQLLGMETCEGEAHDNSPTAVAAQRRRRIANGLAALLPPGAAPGLPRAARTATPSGSPTLGEHAVRGMMRRGMIIDPDHLERARARRRRSTWSRRQRYSGVVSSHSWCTTTRLPADLRARAASSRPTPATRRASSMQWKHLRAAATTRATTSASATAPT